MFIPVRLFFHPGSTLKNLSILTKKIRVLIFPDPGTRVKKASDPGSGSATLLIIL
jgi:hypothetical protein